MPALPTIFCAAGRCIGSLDLEGTSAGGAVVRTPHRDLARTDVEALRPHVGSPTIALLELMGTPASGPRGLAELIVRQTGAAEALRTKDVRDIVLAALDPDEREDLCRVLGHEGVTPHAP